MKRNHTGEIKLVITAALKKELPVQWLQTRGVQVHTAAALASGALRRIDAEHRGVLVVITGAGIIASRNAAEWIRDNLSPLFVVNIGTCGTFDKRSRLGKWIVPEHVSDEKGSTIRLDERMPFHLPAKITAIDCLLTAAEAVTKGNTDRRYNAVDMECFAQAEVFRDAGISFHCLKFSTDYADPMTETDFNAHLSELVRQVPGLFSFLDETIDWVSVIVPVFNREHCIQRAVDSLLSQTRRPDEIIIVDDGSTDRTGELLNDYGDKVRVLQENSGPSRARNEGVKLASYDWVAFMDSDDCWEKKKLEQQIQYHDAYPFFEILQSDEKWIRDGVRVNPHKHHKKPEGWIWEPSLERCLVSPSAVLMKKSLFHTSRGFDENLPVCEDYDLWLTIARRHPVGLEPRSSVVKYGGHHDQLSQKFPAMDRFRVQSLMKQLDRELHPGFKKKIIDLLSKKLHILIQGCEKRGRHDEAGRYKAILASFPKAPN